ncbi:MAG: GNAT family N-acetyltransferase [Candidatus Hodarchaeales archaeon]
MNFKISRLDVKNTSENIINNLASLIYQNAKKIDPYPDVTMERIKNNLLVEDPLVKTYRWIGILPLEPENIISYGIIYFDANESPHYEKTKHLANVNIIVIPEHRRNGFGRLILRELIPFLESMKKTIIQIHTIQDSGTQFCKKHKGKIINKTFESRLLQREIDWSLMKQWCQEGKIRALCVKIEIFFEIPKQDIEAVAQLSTEVLSQEPSGEVEGSEVITVSEIRSSEEFFRNNNYELIVMVSRESDGRISGVTLTSYSKDQPSRVNQYLTGVKQEFRGRGLGKWLKANMVLHLKKKNPHFKEIITGNRITNDPMLSINQRMGFTLFREEFYFKIIIKELKRKLFSFEEF